MFDDGTTEERVAPRLIVTLVSLRDAAARESGKVLSRKDLKDATGSSSTNQNVVGLRNLFRDYNWEVIRTHSKAGYELVCNPLPKVERTTKSRPLSKKEQRKLDARDHREPASMIRGWDHYPSHYEPSLTSAQDWLMTGLALTRLTHSRVDTVLSNGGRVRVVMASPNVRPLMKHAALQEKGKSRRRDYQEQASTLLNHLLSLRAKYGSRLMQVKTIDFALAYGLDVLRYDSDRERIFVTYYTFAIDQDLPIVELNKGEPWFNLYAAQGEKIWNHFPAERIRENLSIAKATREDAEDVHKLASQPPDERQAALIPYPVNDYREFARTMDHFYVLREVDSGVVGFVLAHTDKFLIARHLGAHPGDEIYLRLLSISQRPFLVVRQISVLKGRRGRDYRYSDAMYDFLFSKLDVNCSLALAFMWNDNERSPYFHRRLGWKKLDGSVAVSPRTATIWYTSATGEDVNLPEEEVKKIFSS